MTGTTTSSGGISGFTGCSSCRCSTKQALKNPLPLPECFLYGLNNYAAANGAISISAESRGQAESHRLPDQLSAAVEIIV
jgi:hypothetical protein